MRPTSLRFFLVACLLTVADSPCRADIVLSGLNGFFAVPAGGENTGEGTNSFATGLALPGTASNSILFTPFASISIPGSSLLPSPEVDIGYFSFYNGITAVGTSASSVGFFLTGSATLLDFDPAVVRPVVAERRIFFSLTPNLTGDPVLDGDVWSSDNGSSALIPEDSAVTFMATGIFYPREIHSPPQYFDFEFTRFTPVSTPVPAPPAAVMLLLGLLPAARLARRRVEHARNGN